MTETHGTRADYYRKCFNAGVAKEDAVCAEIECKEKFVDWWIGKRMSALRPMLIPNDEDDYDSENISMQQTSVDENDDDCIGIQYPIFRSNESNLEFIKMSLISSLKKDPNVKPEHNPQFMSLLKVLQGLYIKTNIDARYDNNINDGTWFSLISPNYQECLGENIYGDKKYTMGRMSFDMFRPTRLICSIQWMFNIVLSINAHNARPLPKCMQSLFEGKSHLLRQYDISTAFTVEPENFQEKIPSSPLRGLITTLGYTLPHPSVPNRFLVLFTGGLLEEAVSKDLTSRPTEKWKQAFGDSYGRTLSSYAKITAAKLFLGVHLSDKMDEKDGSFEYSFDRPIGTDGKTYVDVLYLDEDFRILRGNHGTIYVSTRMSKYSSYNIFS